MAKMFLPFCRLCVHSITYLYQCAEVFKFWVISIEMLGVNTHASVVPFRSVLPILMWFPNELLFFFSTNSAFLILKIKVCYFHTYICECVFECVCLCVCVYARACMCMYPQKLEEGFESPLAVSTHKY